MTQQQPKIRQGEVFLADPENLLAWVLNPVVEERLVVQVMPGPDDSRTPLLETFLVRASEVPQAVAWSADGWTTEGVLPALYGLLDRGSVPWPSFALTPKAPASWGLLWTLILIEGFAVEEPLREMIDQSFYIVHDVHRLIWEARWLAREDPDPSIVENFVQLFRRWFMGETLSEGDQAVLTKLQIKRRITTDAQRLDVVNLFFALARQNGILDRVIISFNGLEDVLRQDKRPVLKQFYEFVESVHRWVTIGGTPLGVMIGFEATAEERAVLRKYQPKLAAEVEAGLHWCRRLLS